MSRARPSPIAAAIAISVLLALAGSYFAGYLWLTDSMYYSLSAPPAEKRLYKYPWQATLFKGAAKIEGAVRRRDVDTDTLTNYYNSHGIPHP